MSTQKEELIVRAGFDNTALASGLRQANHTVKDFGKEVGRDLLSALSAGAIMAQVENIFQKVKAIRAGAEKTGINVEDYQKLSQIANEELPDGAQKFDTALSKLNVNIGKGSIELAKWGIHANNANDALFEIADKMHSIEDPAKRAAMAVALMGRDGASMVPFLERGAAALKAAIGQKPGWTAEDMKAIAEAHQSIESAQNYFTIAIGKSISYFGEFWSGLGRISTGLAAMQGDNKEQAHQWMIEFMAASTKKADAEIALENTKEQATVQDGIAETMRRQNAAADYAQRAAEGKAAAEKKAAEQLQKQIDLNRRYDSLTREKDKVLHEMGSIDQETPTIADLAGRGFTQRLDKQYGAGGKFDLGKGDGPFAKAAQDYELAQKQQQWDIIHGNATFDKAGTLIGGAAFGDKQRMIQAHNLLGAAGLETPAMKLEDMKQHLADIRTDMATVASAVIDNSIRIADQD